MSDCSLITAVTGLACAIINNCSDDEIGLLSAVFSQLGDTLATYLTHKELCDSRKTSKSNKESNSDDKKKDDSSKDIHESIIL